MKILLTQFKDIKKIAFLTFIVS